MRFEIGAMSVGDILDRGLKLLLARLPTFFLINLIVLTPVLIFQLVSPVLIAGQPGQAQILALMGTSLAIILLNLILSPIGTAAALHVIAQEFIDQRVGIGSAFAFAFRRFLTLLLATMTNGLVIVLGCAACCVPGIFFLVLFAFVSQVVVLEGLGAFQAFQRSLELTGGFRWRLLGVFLLLFAILIASGLVQSLLQRILPGMEQVTTPGQMPVFVLRSFPNHLIHTVIGFLMNTLAQTYLSVCLTLFYFDLRIRKEGFDLEMAARQQSTLSS